MSRGLLITAVTGKQGGGVVEAVLSRFSKEFTILAVARNTQSPSALRLAGKSSAVKLVEGNLDDVPFLFRAAKKVSSGPIWGVYSAQAAVTKGTIFEGEILQGKALIEESIMNDVKHFVYSSVDRGGNERSWTNPTPILHFKMKHQIEQYLRDSVESKKSTMGWTILRLVIFLDNITADFQSQIFMMSLRIAMKDKPLQWIATSDIGVFAVEAFTDSDQFDKKAIGLAGEELTFEQLDHKFRSVTGNGVGTTVGLLGKALKAGVKEDGLMLDWFKEEGYNVGIQLARSFHPHIKDVGAWLKQDSPFVTR
ncbi:hypothetical protein F52700_2707 [Fusarium sp. NRRL 52700]|nr:hypothetical protein F52700_2707 [Fusarium sp. NRRL 52700]